jgi:hypothetical protein
VRKRSRPVTRASVIVEAAIKSNLCELVSRYKLRAIFRAAI